VDDIEKPNEFCQDSIYGTLTPFPNRHLVSDTVRALRLSVDDIFG
jgi:hypothetical protein